MSVQREKGDSWGENSEPHTHNLIWPHVSKFTETRSSCDKIIKLLDNRNIRNLRPSVISPHTQIVKKVRAFPLRRLGTLTTFLWTFLVFNFNSTFLEGRGLGVINKWAQSWTHFILSSARWSPATIEILTVRRILSRKYWAVGSAGPISGGQKAKSTTHKLS